MAKFLSGPVYFAKAILDNKTYIFLGDHHGDFSNSCASSCMSLNDNLDVIGNDTTCMDIFKYLDDEFIDAEVNSTYIDFFIEAGFKNIGEYSQPYHGYLSRMKFIFDRCIYRDISKQSCPYYNVRFHYADIRTNQDWEALLLPFYLYFEYRTMITTLRYMYEHEEGGYNKDIDDYIRTMNWLYGIKDGKRRDIVMMEIYLSSDNYVFDMENLLNEYGGNVPEFVTNTLFNDSIVVYRHNKVMSRIRAQLEALQYQNEGLADDIEHFIINEYIELTENLDFRDFKEFERAYEYMESFNFNIRYFAYPRHTYPIPLRSVNLLMDAYLLGRMFRKFVPDSNKVIVYAGLNHILLYVKFLKLMGVDVMSTSENISMDKPNRCLKVARFY